MGQQKYRWHSDAQYNFLPGLRRLIEQILKILQLAISLTALRLAPHPQSQVQDPSQIARVSQHPSNGARKQLAKDPYKATAASGLRGCTTSNHTKGLWECAQSPSTLREAGIHSPGKSHHWLSEGFPCTASHHARMGHTKRLLDEVGRQFVYKN
jgi:hypothetical protein